MTTSSALATKSKDAPQIERRATTDLLFAEGSELADDEVDLPARCPVDHVERGLVLLRFQGVQIHIVFSRAQKIDEGLQLIRGWGNHDVSMSWSVRGAP